MSFSSSYSLGLFFIFLVAVIWSIASIVVQYLYTDQHFDSPFLLTYIGTSLFILLLVSHSLWERRHVCHCTDLDQETDIIPWRTSNTYQQVPSTSESVSLENVQIDFTEPSPNDKHETDDVCTTIDSHTVWSHEQHVRVAVKIAPVWFVANWAYNCSLAYTSITSSTVLASTGSLFTFLFAVLCGDETFTILKLLGVLLGVTGSILTGLHDVTNSNNDGASPEEHTSDDTSVNPSILCVAGPSGTPHYLPQANQDLFAGHAIWGDALGLLSAVGYGAYAVMIRIYCPRDERLMSMQLLLGYIGLFNAITLSPITIYILLKPTITDGDGSNGSAAAAIGLTWVVFGFLVAKGTLDNVLSDYLWARAVVLTSATVATVGLGLTIPLAFVSDWFMGHSNVLDAQSVAGAFAVLAGFVIVNVGEKGDESVEDTAVSELVVVTDSSSEITEDGHQ